MTTKKAKPPKPKLSEVTALDQLNREPIPMHVENVVGDMTPALICAACGNPKSGQCGVCGN